MRNMKISCLLVSIVVLSGCLSGGRLFPQCSQVNETYEDYILYPEDVTYEEKQPYTVYLKNELVNTTFSKGTHPGGGSYAQALVQLRNADAEAGWFTVIVEFTAERGSVIKNARHYIEAGSVDTFILAHDTGEEVTGRVIYAQSDPVTRYNIIKKRMTVIRNITENKTRTREVC